MKTITDFLVENSTEMPGFLISRSTMPQIKDVDAMLSYLSSIGVTYHEDPSMSMKYVRPTQHNYERDKVDAIKNQLINNNDSKMKPIIVSYQPSIGEGHPTQFFVLDGHHRYLAAKELGVGISAIVINCPINKLLKICLDKEF